MSTTIDVGSDARSLSSGTMATICRQDGILHDYQCREYTYLDEVQARFALFCEGSKAETWQEAWQEWVKRFHWIHSRCWYCSYAGSVYYQIDGVRYEVCHDKDKNFGWNGDYFETGIVYHVGCIFREHCMSDGFPPDSVLAFFPGFVPLSATFEWEDLKPGERFRSIKEGSWQYIHDERFGPPKQHWGTGWKAEHLLADWQDDDDRIDWETDSKCQYHKRHRR